jgi:methionyl-tRNA formyltransferase
VRLVYLGTPEMAVPPLDALIASGHDVVLVVTGADKRRGRGSGTSPSPVKQAAVRLGIPVSHTVDDVLTVGAELGVVVAFGRIIKPHVLAELQMVNLHFSLLPRWRGAAPVERALLAGDDVTGVCVMAVEEGLDTGGVYACREVAIESAATLDSLRRELVEVGSRLLVDTLAEGLGVPRPQAGEATYAAKIDPAELRIDWSRSPHEIDRLVRLGGAWTTFRGGRVKIHEARLEGDTLVPVVVQPEGRPRMDYAAWRNGARPADGERFE